MKQDDQHLRLLSIFHHVVAGIVALFALFPLIHLVSGIAMLSTSLERQEGPDTRLVGLLFVPVATVFILCVLAFAVLAHTPAVTSHVDGSTCSA